MGPLGYSWWGDPKWAHRFSFMSYCLLLILCAICTVLYLLLLYFSLTLFTGLGSSSPIHHIFSLVLSCLFKPTVFLFLLRLLIYIFFLDTEVHYILPNSLLACLFYHSGAVPRFCMWLITCMTFFVGNSKMKDGWLLWLTHVCISSCRARTMWCTPMKFFVLGSGTMDSESCMAELYCFLMCYCWQELWSDEPQVL
jgi:hypothetical protein